MRVVPSYHPRMTLTDIALRQRAEESAHADASLDTQSVAEMSPQAMQQMIHDLRVHQIELEMQNEQLRQMQSELDTAQARFFDFYDLAPAGYVSVNDQNQILQANLATASLLGVTRRVLHMQLISRFIVSEDQDVFYLLRQTIRTTGAAQSCDLRLRQPDGLPVWVKLQAIAVTAPDGQPMLRMVLSDITERKALEAQRVRDEAKLRTILDGASDAIFITDQTGRYQYVNQLATQLLGFDQSELLHMSFHDITPAHDLPEVMRLFEQLLAAGSMRFELTLKRRDGSTVLVELSGTLLADGSVYGACRDITERKQLQVIQLERAVETEVAASRQRLRELVALNQAELEEERRHMAREVHDELGQVLTALRMDLSLLDMRHGKRNPALRTEVGGMKTLVDRAIQGVRNVATHLRPTALDMGLVPAIDWLCQEFAHLTGLACHLDAPGNLELDKTREIVVFRIVQESLTNITRYASASQVHIVLRHRGQDLTLQVADNGQGFNMGQAEQRKTFGLLGMRERAIALGGTLVISSVPGRGTTVDLTIPFTAGPSGDAT